MNNLLQILLGLVIAALVTILAAPYFIDWNQYKSEIETQASRLVGHNLTVAGDVHLRLLPAPYLQLENITVHAPNDATDTPPLLTAKAFRLWLSAPPLLRGVIEVQEIEVVQPHLRFAIDENGKSNWYQNRSSNHSLPFTPKAVSLQSMKIKDGTLEISTIALGTKSHTSKNRKLLIEALNGNFSAGSLKGPYKFDGMIGKDEKQQILRVSTGSIDEKDAMRVKGILRSPQGGQRYSFDGSVSDLKNHPTMHGVLSASFPFFTSTQKDAKNNPKIHVKPIEVKTSINANTAGALFDKILITIVHKNRPQMMTGKGRLSWDKGKIDLDGNLNARLIDVDHLKDGMKVGNSVGEAVKNLFASLQAQAVKIDSGRFHININQIKLNGDLVQDLKINLEQTDKNLLVKKLFARLPGDNMIEIQGGFEGPSKASMFKGHGVIRGQSLGHFVTWTAGTKVDGGISAIRSHPFTLRGNLLFSDDIWALHSVHGDIAGTSFTGEISHSLREIDLKLTTSEINSTALVGRPVAMREIIADWITPTKPQSPSTSDQDPQASGLRALIKDNILKLQLRAGRLRLDDFDGRDLIADVYFGLKRVQINELSLRSQNGLRLQADGTIDNLEKNPTGTLTATINVEDDQELQQFISWFTPPKTSIFTTKQIASLTPLRLAVMLQTASNTGAEANVRINGVAGRSHIALNNHIIGLNLFSRREQRSIHQLELSGTVTNTDGRLLLTQLVPYLPIDQEQLQLIGNSKIWFSAAGLPDKGLNSRVEFISKRVTAGFDGLLGWKKGASVFEGTTRLKAKDMASGLALIGIDTRNKQSSGSLDLTATLHKKGSRYDFTSIRGSLASSDVEGRATLELAATGKKLNLVLLTSALHVPLLFSPLLEKPQQKHANLDQSPTKAALQLAANVQEEVGFSQQVEKPVMTNRRFTSDLLRDITADILITADKLFISDKIILNNGDLSATIKDHKITIKNLGGQLWGGQMQARGNLDLSATLATIDGDIMVSKVAIEKAPFAIDQSPIAEGTLSLDMDFEGRGIGPAGLFSLLNGKGDMTFTKAKINRLSSSVLSDIVDDELTVWTQSEDQTPFKERFRRHLLHADFNIPSLSEDFIIKDGTLLFKTTQSSKQNSKLDLDASLTLASMTTHSRLTISPLKNAKYANLPSASILYEGSLLELNAITPKIETASLEQHLKVMKMEHDVNLLEKLHKRDEEFAQKAAERRAQAKRRYEAEMAEKAQMEALEHTETPSPEEDLTKPPSQNWIPFDQSPGSAN